MSEPEAPHPSEAPKLASLSADDTPATALPPTEMEKSARREKEKAELLASLARGDFTTLKAKVAGMLNLFPNTRNSDVALALKYWETFQPAIYNPTGILPRDLFKLERLHYIVRARAKIQNEYGLFLADSNIRGHRRGREEEMQEAVLEDAPPRRVVFAYADETGKTQDYVIVAAVWVLNGYEQFRFSQSVDSWKAASVWQGREIHFARFGKADLTALGEYLALVAKCRDYFSFKLIALKRSTTRRPIEEVVLKLHEHMLLRGVEHEVRTGRIDLPRDFELVVDAEDSLDPIHLEEMRTRINHELSAKYGTESQLQRAECVSSRNSSMLQLADLVAGATNRRLNHKGDRNYKDDMADLIVHALGLQLVAGDITDLDASALFLL